MTRLNYSERVVRLAKSLWKDTSGIMLPYVTIMLVAFFGLGLLAVDGSRYMSLQTQMQAAADGLALAGAAELNKKSGAIANARSAMASFVDNRLSGMAFTAKLGYSATFYQNLPAANTLPSSGTVATTDANAHFVLVTVTPVTVPTIFSVTYLNPLESNNFTAGAQAVAGHGPEGICGIPPVYICNPWEGSGTSLIAALADPAERRRQWKILNDGTNGPGHFGWLVPPDCTAARF